MNKLLSLDTVIFLLLIIPISLLVVATVAMVDVFLAGFMATVIVYALLPNTTQERTK